MDFGDGVLKNTWGRIRGTPARSGDPGSAGTAVQTVDEREETREKRGKKRWV